MKSALAELLEQLDEETRGRWAEHLRSVEAELADKGPGAAKEHLEAALRHLLAVGWALHRCYRSEEAIAIMGPLGEAATTVEKLRTSLELLAKKPEWAQ